MPLLAPIPKIVFEKLKAAPLASRDIGDREFTRIDALLDSARLEIGYFLVEGKIVTRTSSPTPVRPDRFFFSPVRHHVLESYQVDSHLEIETRCFQYPRTVDLDPHSLFPIPAIVFQQVTKVRLDHRLASGCRVKHMSALLDSGNSERNLDSAGYFLSQFELIFWSAIEMPASCPKRCFFSPVYDHAVDLYRSDSHLGFEVTGSAALDAKTTKQAVSEVYGIDKMADDAFVSRRGEHGRS